MKKLEPKYQLTFPSDKEIRITYPKHPNIWIGQVSNAVLSVSLILLFLAAVTEFLNWNLLLVFLSLSVISILFRWKFPSNSLKEVYLRTDLFKYNYAVGMNNREKYVRPPMFIDFQINIQFDLIKVSFMDISVDLHNAEDLPIFIDKVAAMFNMKYVDTCRLSNQKEILMYQRDTVTNTIYPTLINVINHSNGVEFYDMMNQYVWLKFDEVHQHIYHYDSMFVLPSLMIPYSDVRQIDVIINAGKWVESGKNRIVVNVILNNNTKKMVFESIVRTADKELTSYRDVNIIVKELEKLSNLKSIKITKQFNIQ